MPEKAIRNKNRKRGLKVVAVAGGLVLVGGVAFAYWTQGGTGSGSATTGGTNPITVTQTSAITGLAPGLDAQTLSGKFNNPNNGPVFVHQVKVEISSIDSPGTCSADDYTLTNATVPVDAEVPAGSGVGGWTGATIAFNDKADTNQDGCKGATVHLAYTAS
jgi:hypothetical protein